MAEAAPITHEFAEQIGESKVEICEENTGRHFRKKLEECVAHTPLRVFLHLHHSLKKWRVEYFGSANDEHFVHRANGFVFDAGLLVGQQRVDDRNKMDHGTRGAKS